MKIPKNSTLFDHIPNSKDKELGKYKSEIDIFIKEYKSAFLTELDKQIITQTISKSEK